MLWDYQFSQNICLVTSCGEQNSMIGVKGAELMRCKMVRVTWGVKGAGLMGCKRGGVNEV